MYQFGKFILRIPDDHKIAEIHQQDLFYDRAYGFILEEVGRDNPDSVFVDIGANVGDTAAFFATYVRNPIIAVEGSPDFLPFLRANAPLLGDQLTVIEAFIRAKALAGRLMRHESGGGTGTLNFAPSEEQSNVSEQAFMSVENLLAYAREGGREVGLIKSDTDGFDGFLMLDVLESEVSSPLFFECDTIHTIADAASPWPEVFKTLAERDYRIIVFDNFGLPVAAATRDVDKLLTDLSGYIRLQYDVRRIRLYYLDVWAFPPSQNSLFDRVCERMRTSLLAPHGFG